MNDSIDNKDWLLQRFREDIARRRETLDRWKKMGTRISVNYVDGTDDFLRTYDEQTVALEELVAREEAR